MKRKKNKRERLSVFSNLMDEEMLDLVVRLHGKRPETLRPSRSLTGIASWLFYWERNAIGYIWRTQRLIKKLKRELEAESK